MQESGHLRVSDSCLRGPPAEDTSLQSLSHQAPFRGFCLCKAQAKLCVHGEAERWGLFERAAETTLGRLGPVKKSHFSFKPWGEPCWENTMGSNAYRFTMVMFCRLDDFAATAVSLPSQISVFPILALWEKLTGSSQPSGWEIKSCVFKDHLRSRHPSLVSTSRTGPLIGCQIQECRCSVCV